MATLMLSLRTGETYEEVFETKTAESPTPFANNEICIDYRRQCQTVDGDKTGSEGILNALGAGGYRPMRR